MRCLTFNLWHGLSPSNMVAFEPLEPTARRRLREELQIKVLSDLNPDICFLQEVSPITQRADDLGQSLNMSACVQPDLVGLKLFGVGLPLNLNSGLAALVAHRFGVKMVKGQSLSRPGGFKLVHTWGSLQTQEERFALFAETLLPKWGRVLLVNTHLHHGLESTEEMLQDLAKLEEELRLPPHLVREMKERLAKGNKRREKELRVLLDALDELKGRYEAVVLAGDFNASPKSQAYKMLAEAGFRDAWAEAQAESDGFSYDHQRNSANHLLQGRFPLTFAIEDLSFAPQVKEALLAMARRHEARPRRIDYLWFRSDSLSLKVRAADLVGLPDQEGLAPSDHFGVYADIDVI